MYDTPQYWARHIAAIDAQSLSAAEYARRQGLDAQQIYRWRYRLKNKSINAASTHNEVKLQQTQSRRFISVQLQESVTTSSSACTLRLAPGISLELCSLPDATWLASLINASRSQ